LAGFCQEAVTRSSPPVPGINVGARQSLNHHRHRHRSYRKVFLMRIGFAQLNPTVGDFAGNSAKILAAYRDLVSDGADVVLAPELALPGYPPQDLLFKSQFVPRNLAAIEDLHTEVGKVPLIVGYVDLNTGPGRPFRNAAAVLQKGRPIQKIFKTLLPTYDVFDESRYFEPASPTEPGAHQPLIEIAGTRCGITICEDIWSREYLPRELYERDPLTDLVVQGAQLILNLSASPFEIGKPRRRLEMLSARAAAARLPIAYCNAVGGNDELIFDGNSLALDATGALLAQRPSFKEDAALVEIHIALEGSKPAPAQGAAAFLSPTSKREAPNQLRAPLSSVPDAAPPEILNPKSSLLNITPVFPLDEADLFHALALGTRDYLHKCGFKSAVLGLSGGIDSAVTAAIAAEALGPENVLGVTMPTRFSSEGSVADSLQLARALGLRCLTIPIEKPFAVFKDLLTPHFEGRPEDVTEENMQPRLRGMALMALSNKLGHLLLTTGNKSELAVGYCTLYGDMCGGLAVISDVPKMMIYRLARWLNRDREIIPWATIEKPPSAELRPNQRDQDTLPPYEILDAILELLVEDHLSVDEIAARGFEPETVRWVARRVAFNEYKRAQAVPGLKVTGKAFGIGRKMPVAQRYAE
jgi:NAD+ synthase (glutamine-hydrolysing)